VLLDLHERNPLQCHRCLQLRQGDQELVQLLSHRVPKWGGAAQDGEETWVGGTRAGMTLHQAALSGDVAEVRRLVASGVKVDERDEFGSTALHYAAFPGDVEVMRVLVELGVQVDAQAVNGETPLQTSVRHGEVL
jgi:hypothetical protein